MTLRTGLMPVAILLLLNVACSNESPNGGGGTGASGGAGGATTDATGTGGASGHADSGTSVDAGEGRPTELPISDSQIDIGAFIERRGYKSATWISETAAPREQNTSASQPGSTVRVWENPPLVDSLKAGRDGRDGHPYPDRWSMAVKELYDVTSGELVGVAASFKTAAGPDFSAWTYYCYGPDSRCSFQGAAPIDKPVYGKGSASPANQCGICHGYSVFTIPP